MMGGPSADRPSIIFTHVPKTSGTSFRMAVVEPNIPAEAMYQWSGIATFLRDRRFRPAFVFVFGHFPYGLHYFLRGDVTYITFLRDPVDRAVSYYYFVKDSDPAVYVHPARGDAERLSITEFYDRRSTQNLQTRFLAGLVPHRLYPHVARRRFDRAILTLARRHLIERYAYFGILERYEESVRGFQRHFGWERTTDVAPQKTTRSRPKVSDLDADTRASLERSHRLDRALYDFALERFTRAGAAIDGLGAESTVLQDAR